VKRHILAAILATLCSLVVVGTAAAWDHPAPPPAPPISHIQQDQGNASDQQQVQVVPIAPQVNVQNVNVLTSGDVSQGDANNANTGQANQQQSTQVAVQQGSGESKDTPCSSCSPRQPASPGSGDQAVDQHQGNSSDQQQVQVVPIAPQANVQNVNAGTSGDVSQGDANNANTGQANQQDNTQVAAQSGGPVGGQSQTTDQGQGNQSSQGQVQVVPIAPQVNVQNVNVLTSGDVSQGDANNANTGQANQQQNTQVAVQKGSGGPSHDGCDCSSKGPEAGSDDPSVNQHQGNWSKQKQIQVVPIAPQLNVQNVNVGTGGEVRQGDANNANTGQANQQHNTQVAVQHGGSRPGKAPIGPTERTRPMGSPSPGGSSIDQGQGNWSKQDQLQIVPIAPQANVQNANAFTYGNVRQGDANNANTGQANQQHNTQVAAQKATRPSHPAPGKIDCKPAGKPTPPSPGGKRVKQHQGNWNEQNQLQFVPVAPQVNLQNVNLLTWGSVRQGDANNANTGQANQQDNTQIAWQQERLPHGDPSPA
jgi:hypothetical protein